MLLTRFFVGFVSLLVALCPIAAQNKNIVDPFKRADASGARHALIFGADEVARGEVAIKPLRDAAAPQRSRALADVAAWAHELRTA